MEVDDINGLLAGDSAEYIAYVKKYVALVWGWVVGGIYRVCYVLTAVGTGDVVDE